jgi:hypothetical protein
MQQQVHHLLQDITLFNSIGEYLSYIIICELRCMVMTSALGERVVLYMYSDENV